MTLCNLASRPFALTFAALLLVLPTYVHGACKVVPDWSHQMAMTSATFSTTSQQLDKQGFVVESICGYPTNGESRYAAIWVKRNAGPQRSQIQLSQEDLLRLVAKNEGEGYWLASLNAHTLNGVDVYSGIWRKTQNRVELSLTAAELAAQVKQRATQNQRLISLSGYGVTSSKFAAVWASNPFGPVPQIVRFELNTDQFDSARAELDKTHSIKFLSAYNIAGVDYYAAVWERTLPNQRSATISHFHVGSPAFQCMYDQYVHQGYVPTQLVGYIRKESTRIAAVFQLSGMTGSDLDKVNNEVHAFMKKFKVPELSLAVAQEGRLVFGKAYKQDEAKQTIVDNCPTTRFRIASLSKPITAAAIYKMVEQNKLRLTDKVFGAGALLGTTYGDTSSNQYVGEITVGQLISHTAGGIQWDNNKNDGFTDPVFDLTLRPLNITQLITSVLASRTVTTKPGVEYRYSNFGYAVLGQVIETVTGVPYQTWVQQNILQPCNALGPQIAGNTLVERRPDEVMYVQTESAMSPYDIKVSRMAAHGGWISSAEDLVRFGTCVDGYASRADVLSEENARSLSSDKFSSSEGWFPNGNMPGTAAYMGKPAADTPEDQYVWAIITNIRVMDAGQYLAELKALGNKLVARGTVSSWSCTDLTQPLGAP